MNLKDVILKCNGTILNPEISIPETFHHIKTDTRELEAEDIYIALKGKNYNGHQYVEEAIQKGACAIIVEEEIRSEQCPIIKVTNTYDCLFDLSRLYLETYPVFVVAITGSVGKTTTKELIASILEKKYQVLKSKGNKNNRIGIPQTIFELNHQIDCLVVELGMNHFHEIDQLSRLVRPNIAVITNIGSAHIGNLGSKKNILKAKMEILDGLDGGILVLNSNDRMLKKVKTITNGIVKRANWKEGDFEIELLEQTIFGSKLKIKHGAMEMPVMFSNPGLSILDDISLALQVGDILDVPFLKMVEAIQEYHGVSGRFLVEKLSDGNVLVNDCYNSSYEALKMDLELLEQCKEKKILILGDILELGKKSKKIHKKVGKIINNMKDSDIYLIGQEMKYAWKQCQKAKYYIDKNEFLCDWAKQEKPSHSVILLKGSRKMKLEELIFSIKDC